MCSGCYAVTRREAEKKQQEAKVKSQKEEFLKPTLDSEPLMRALKDMAKREKVPARK